MLTGEFKMEEAIAVWKEEGREEGVVIGETKGEARVLSLFESGRTLNEVREILNRKNSIL
ncbi:MAG: hypothetical protein FWG42_03075 [Clostridiales bacterium]|nr:hypothetical protein [Clostridiales bacterium]